MKKIGYTLILFSLFLITAGVTLAANRGLVTEAAPEVNPDQAAPQPRPQALPTTPQWQQLSPTPDPTDGSPGARFNHSMVYHQGTNKAYIFGGQVDGSNYLNDVWALDLNTMTWDRLFLNNSGTANTAFPVQRRTPVMMIDIAGQNLYIATGQLGGTEYNDIWRFALSTNSWTKLCTTPPCQNTVPIVRYGAAGAALSGDLIVSHGFDASGRRDDTWRFDVDTGQWQKISPAANLPIGRCLLDGAAVGNKFIIHGGQSNSDTYRADTWIFDTVSQTWTEIASGGTEGVNKPEGRFYQSLVEYEAENGVLLFGGRDGSNRFNDVWFLNLAQNTWSELSPTGTPPPARRSQAAVWRQGNDSQSTGMLVFGGSTASGDTNALADLWLLTFPAPGTLHFSSSVYEVIEGNTQAVISVTRTGGVSGTVTVDYEASGGTAVNGQDYISMSGTVTFNNGDSSTKSFNVPILDDTVADNDKTVNLTLKSPTNGATLGTPSTAVLTILDSDTVGRLQFSKSSYDVAKMSGSTTISVTRAGGVSGTVMVDYKTGDGTAKAGQDYMAVSGKLTFNSGVDTLRTFTVPILTNADTQSKTVNLIVENPSGGAVLGSPSTALLTIKGTTPNDDGDGNGTTDTLIYLPVVLKTNEMVDEHAAELLDIFPE